MKPTYGPEARDSLLAAVSIEDMVAMVQKQVEKAKDGDQRSFEVILKLYGPMMFDRSRTLAHDEEPLLLPAPVDHAPGTRAKLDVLAKRRANGEKLFHANDRRGYD